MKNAKNIDFCFHLYVVLSLHTKKKCHKRVIHNEYEKSETTIKKLMHMRKFICWKIIYKKT